MTERKTWVFWLMVGIGFFLFLYCIKSILLPFVLGILTAYFLDPAADKLEKWGCSRSSATVLITIGFSSLVVLLGILLLPLLGSQLMGLLEEIPHYAHELEARFEPKIHELLGQLNIVDTDSIRNSVSDASSDMLKLTGSFLTGVFA